MTELGKLSWTDAKALIDDGCAAILPVGSTEAHGPHLPLDTDVTIALGMARRAAASLAENCVVLPPVAYSVTEFAAPFPGTLTLPRQTALAHLRDVLARAVTMGFRPVAVANAHLEPAHIETVHAAIAAVAATTGVTVVFPDITRRRLAQRLGEEFRSGACHAGRYEGSLVMADDPEAVKDELRRQLPEVPISLVDAIRSGHADFLAAGGSMAYFGAPGLASAEEGRATYQVLASILVEAMEAAGS